MNGSVQTLEFEAFKIHIYTAPSEYFRTNSTILELSDRLIVIDGQMFRQFAREVGDVIEGLSKRIDRFILSHNHPDHYAGFEHLTKRFPGVQLAALPSIRDYLVEKGTQVLAVRRSLFGDEVASQIVIPDATIVPGKLVIAGVQFVFQQYDDTESEHTLAIILPDLGVALVADMVGGVSDHLFTVQPNFDAWETAVNMLRADVARYGIKTIVVGHGDPISPAALPANIEYLEAVKKAYATAATSDDFVAAVTASQPDRSPKEWLDWSGQMLYGHVAP